MKLDRSVEISNFATNLGMMLKNDKAKTVAFTTDADKYDLMGFMTELAKIYSESGKVAIATYSEVNNKVDGVNYIVLDAVKDNKRSIASKFKAYDMVMVMCPNMITSKTYLHVATYVANILFVSKKWQSKTSNIIAMKELATSSEMNVVGIVYEN